MSLYLCVLSYMCVGTDKSKNHRKQAKTGQKTTREPEESKAGAEAVFYQSKPDRIELTRDRIQRNLSFKAHLSLRSPI